MYLRALLISIFLLISSPAAASGYPSWLEPISQTIGENATDVDHSRELACLALTVYHESRGEPVAGQRAVAAVVMNRVKSGRYAKNVCGVVFQRSQFSFIHKKSIKPNEMRSWSRALEIAREYINGNTHVPYMNFRQSSRRGFRIGSHVFF